MINEDWKTNDDLWLANQEKKWDYFKERFIRHLDASDPEQKRQQESNIELGELYSTGVIRELPYKGEFFGMWFHYSEWILMHPNPTEEVIRKIIQDYPAKGYTASLPYPPDAPDLTSHLVKLNKICEMNDSIVESFMNVVYGQSLRETLNINNLDFDKLAVKFIGSYLGRVSSWVVQAKANDPHDITLIDRWILFSKELLLMLKDEHVAKAKFVMRDFFRFLSSFEGQLDGLTESIRIDSIPRNCEIVADLRNELISNRNAYCPKLQEHIEKLESDLKADGKL